MSQTILVPLDLNQDAVFDSVFENVKRVAGNTGATVILLSVIPQIDAGDFPYVGTDYVRKLGETAHAQLERVGRQYLGEDSNWQVDVRVGPVARTIVRRADHFGVDLIVMASHNPKFWDVLLGSIASQVVKHSQHSVLVVRQKREPHAADIHDESRDPLAD
ncbi:universal stress protein [uncultured Salinisphaera sp.]|uniref:universal stress protein n=1 Tax=uncultured Salinisphaera sp. TaxID=359372 RepID=UPI0032B11B5B